METIEAINARLVDRFGRDVYGNAKFRVVWSDDQIEKRNGTVNEFYGGVFVRATTGVHEWPKYPFFKHRHILEMCCINTNPELVTQFTYEPLYKFEDKNGNALPLDWECVEFFMHCLLYGKPTAKSDWDEQDRKEREREEQLAYDYLDNQSPYLASKIRDGEAAFIDSTKVFGDSNGNKIIRFGNAS